MSKYSTQVHCAWFITVQQITVIMQQILQIMEKPGRMEKVWKNCWGLRRIWENISALVSAAADGSIFVGADLSPDRDNENAQTTADSGEEDSAYDNLKMEFFYLSPDGNVQKVDTGDTIQSSYTFQACFTENGTVLIVDPGNGVAEINPSDGSLVRRYEEGISVDFYRNSRKNVVYHSGSDSSRI